MLYDNEFPEYNIGDRVRDQLSGARGTVVKKDTGTDCDGEETEYYICQSDDGKHFTRVSRYLATLEHNKRPKKNPPRNQWVLISNPDAEHTKRYKKQLGGETYYATIFLDSKGEYQLIIVDEDGEQKLKERVISFDEAYHYMNQYSQWK